MKNTINRGLNLALYLAFCAMAGTGLLIALRLPPGSRGGAGLTALGWTRHQWGDLHMWIGYAFMALIVVHLAVHWAWLRKIAAGKHAWRLWLGLLGGVGIIAALALLPVEKRETGAGGGRGAGQGQGRGGPPGRYATP